ASLLERERPEVESQNPKAEILEFPAKQQSSAHVSPPDGIEAGVGASDDLRFWRIACGTAVLAIASLLLGVNWSRTPQPAVRAPRESMVVAPSPPVRHHAKAFSKKSELPMALSTKPSAAGATLGKSVPPPVAVARKAEDLRKPAGKRSAKSSSDAFVAKDTVTY